MKQNIYKIQRKKDGNFADGATRDYWSKKGGKVWKAISHIKNHLRSFSDCFIMDYGEKKYRNAEVVVYEIREVDRFPVTDLIKELKEKDKRSGKK